MSTTKAFASCLSTACGLWQQHRRLCEIGALPLGERARAFDALRREKVERLEFRHHHVDFAKARVAPGVDLALLRKNLGAVGFPAGLPTQE